MGSSRNIKVGPVQNLGSIAASIWAQEAKRMTIIFRPAELLMLSYVLTEHTGLLHVLPLLINGWVGLNWVGLGWTGLDGVGLGWGGIWGQGLTKRDLYQKQKNFKSHNGIDALEALSQIRCMYLVLSSAELLTCDSPSPSPCPLHSSGAGARIS